MGEVAEMIHGRKTPRCSPTAGRRPDAAPRQEDAAADIAASPSSADARNREEDAWGDYLDALGELRKTRSLRDAYVAAALFWRWLAIKGRRV